MQVSYNLKYQKANFANKVLIEKEGEIIIYDRGFKLRGKGATDKGEMINYCDIKEFYYRNDKLFFITFAKAKYTLSGIGTAFEEFLRTIYKSRNEFLVEALFMRHGKLKGEFDAYFDRYSKFSKPINKGDCKLKLYEGGLVIVPEDQDAFGINFNFVNFHEFVDDEYQWKITMDDGSITIISHLGNDYEMFQENINEVFGSMYEKLVNEDLKEVFYDFDAGTLLKLAYKLRGGKTVNLKEIQKMDKALADRVLEFFFNDKVLAEKFDMFNKMTDEYSRYFGIAKDPLTHQGFVRWLMYALPEYNTVVFCILNKWIDEDQPVNPKGAHDTFFFKIIIEKGLPSEKVADKVLEIEQSLVNLNFTKDPCYKDKKELRNSPFRYAIRKLPYLRILRKSYSGMANAESVSEWQKQAKEILEKSKLNN